jgi:hypothetical protein
MAPPRTDPAVASVTLRSDVDSKGAPIEVSIGLVGQMWAIRAAYGAKATRNKRLRDDSNGIRAR